MKRLAAALVLLVILAAAATAAPGDDPAYAGPQLLPPGPRTEEFSLVAAEHGINEAIFDLTPTGGTLRLPDGWRIRPGDRHGYQCAYVYLVSGDATPVEAVLTLTYVDPGVVINDRGMPEYNDGPGSLPSPPDLLPWQGKRCPSFTPPPGALYP